MGSRFFWIFTLVATAILLFVVTTRNHSARGRVDERKAATRSSDKFNTSSSVSKENLIDATADQNSSPLADKTIQSQVVVTPVPKLEEKKSQWTYVEAFKGLNTKNWLYRHHKPELVDEAERRSLEKHQKHFDDRLTPLFEIKKDYWWHARENDNYKALRDIFENSETPEVAFQNGKMTELSEVSKLQRDNIACIVRFNRSKEIAVKDSLPNIFFQEAEIIEREKWIKGVRIGTAIDPAKNFESFIKSFDCFVRVTGPEDKMFQNILFLHLVATIGIDGNLYGKPIAH